MPNEAFLQDWSWSKGSINDGITWDKFKKPFECLLFQMILVPTNNVQIT